MTKNCEDKCKPGCSLPYEPKPGQKFNYQPDIIEVSCETIMNQTEQAINDLDSWIDEVDLKAGEAKEEALKGQEMAKDAMDRANEAYDLAEQADGKADNLHADLTDHINDTNNPHQTTADQVGAYTKDETNTLVENAFNDYDAPADGHQYVRKDSVWEKLTGNLVIDANEKMLSQSENGLRSTLTLNLDSARSVLQILGINGQVVNEVTLPGYQFLESAEIITDPAGQPVGTYLAMTFETHAGPETVYIDVTKLVDIYTPGNTGIGVSNYKISLIVDGNSPFEVGPDGLKFKAGFQAMTDAQVQKLNGIEAGAQVNTVTSVNGKVGDVTLTAADVGALSSGETTTAIELAVASHNNEKDAHANLFGPKILKRLTGNITYFVRKEGNDTNDGLTPATAFATRERGLEEARSLDCNGFSVIINIGPGVWSGFLTITNAHCKNSGGLIIQGSGVGDCIFEAPSSWCINISTTNAFCQLRDIKMRNGSIGIHLGVEAKANISAQVEFGEGLNTHIHLSVRAHLLAHVGYRIIGAASVHAQLMFQSYMEYSDSTVIELLNTARFTGQFLSVHSGAVFIKRSAVFNGTVTGSRVHLRPLSYIYLNGQGVASLPGSTDGYQAPTAVVE